MENPNNLTYNNNSTTTTKNSATTTILENIFLNSPSTSNNNFGVGLNNSFNNEKLNPTQFQSFRAMLNALASQNSPPNLNSPGSVDGHQQQTISIASPGSAFAYLKRTTPATITTADPSFAPLQEVIARSPAGLSIYETAASTSAMPSSCESASSAFSQPPTPLNRCGSNNSSNPQAMLAAALANPANLSLLAFYQNSSTNPQDLQQQQAKATTNPLNNLAAFEQFSKLLSTNNSATPVNSLDSYLMLQKLQNQLQQHSQNLIKTTLPTQPFYNPQQQGFEHQISKPNCSGFNRLLSPASTSANSSANSLIPVEVQPQQTIRKIRRRRPKSPRLINNQINLISSTTTTTPKQYSNHFKNSGIRVIKNTSTNASNFQKQNALCFTSSSSSEQQQATTSGGIVSSGSLTPREESFLKEVNFKKKMFL